MRASPHHGDKRMTVAGPQPDRWWRRGNDLALDAAAVAVGWHLAFAHAFGLTASLASLAVLGMSTWLVYLGDRWLDVRGTSPCSPPTQRHRFAARCRVGLLTAWVAVLLADVVLALNGLTPPQLRAGVILLLGSVLYTMGVQRRRPKRWTKELQVALIFAGGVGAFFAGADLRGGVGAGLLAGLAYFGLICFLNCAMLAKWETGADRAMGRSSLALALGKRVAWLRHAVAMSALLGAALALFLPARIMLSLAAYEAILWSMDWAQWPGDPEDRRCLADGLLAALGVAAAVLG